MAETKSAQADETTLPARVAAYEARLIREALETSAGNTHAAADMLGVPVRTLNEKISRHGVRRLS
jgi:two-component system C4-dicarboxylate transport response regulator DctD